MLDAVAVVAMVGALLCLIYAFVASRWDGDRREERVAAFVVALLMLVLAASAAAVSAKVADAGATPSPTPAQASVVSAQDLAAFATVDEIHAGPLVADVCLTRFYTRGEAAIGKWWTPCTIGDGLATVADVRRTLAVKRAWGTYDESTRITLAKGTSVTYVRGVAAEQCDTDASTSNCPYRGGGVQYLFPSALDPHGGTRRCADPSAAAAPTPAAADAARFGPCPTGS